MTVQELIDIENKYREEYQDVPYVFNEVGEYEPANMNDDVAFLCKGFIQQHSHITDDTKKMLAEKGLIDFEILILMCFKLVIFLSAFRWNSYNDKKVQFLKCVRD